MPAMSPRGTVNDTDTDTELHGRYHDTAAAFLDEHAPGLDTQDGEDGSAAHRAHAALVELLVSAHKAGRGDDRRYLLDAGSLADARTADELYRRGPFLGEPVPDPEVRYAPREVCCTLCGLVVPPDERVVGQASGPRGVILLDDEVAHQRCLAQAVKEQGER